MTITSNVIVTSKEAAACTGGMSPADAAGAAVAVRVAARSAAVAGRITSCLMLLVLLWSRSMTMDRHRDKKPCPRIGTPCAPRGPLCG